MELLPRGTHVKSSLALEYGMRVPLGASQEQLQVSRVAHSVDFNQ